MVDHVGNCSVTYKLHVIKLLLLLLLFENFFDFISILWCIRKEYYWCLCHCLVFVIQGCQKPVTHVEWKEHIGKLSPDVIIAPSAYWRPVILIETFVDFIVALDKFWCSVFQCMIVTFFILIIMHLPFETARRTSLNNLKNGCSLCYYNMCACPFILYLVSISDRYKQVK